MTDHAHDIRAKFIADHAARIKLTHDQQRAGWLEYLIDAGKYILQTRIITRIIPKKARP